MEYTITIGELQPALTCGVNVYYGKYATEKDIKNIEVALLPNGYLASVHGYQKYRFQDERIYTQISASIRKNFSEETQVTDNVRIREPEYILTLYGWKKSFTCTATVEGNNLALKAQITEMRSGFVFVSFYNGKQIQASSETLKRIQASLVKKYKEEKRTYLVPPAEKKYTTHSIEYSADAEEKGKYYAVVSLEENVSREFVIFYCGDQKIHILERVSDNKTISFNDRALFECLRDGFFEKFSRDELEIYIKARVNTETQTQYMRIKNAKAANVLCYRENQILAEEHILVNQKRKVLNLFILKDLTSFEVEILSWINIFRYVTSDMITDLFAARLISAEKSSYSKAFLSQKMSSINRFGLVDISRFATLDETGKIIDDPHTQSIARVYTLGANGATLLSQVGRRYHYNAFERFQNANIVKAILAANQWLVYWLFAYPERMENNYQAKRVLYLRGVQLSGARIYASVVCKNCEGVETLIIGEPVRRASETDAEQAANVCDKFDRLVAIFRASEGDIYSSFDIVKLPNKKIICYICEDMEHVNEVYNMLRDKIQKYAEQEIWFTTDLKMHNYDQEGERFGVMNKDGVWMSVNLNERFGLGKERASWDDTVGDADVESADEEN